MKAGNLILDGDRAYYTYRGKGGKQGASGTTTTGTGRDKSLTGGLR